MPPFSKYSQAVEQRISQRYGVPVVTRGFEGGLRGDLDGASLYISPDMTAEDRLFLVLHLFGHTVQWNVDPDAFELGALREPPVEDSLLPGILAYEWQAAGFGLGLLHELGIGDLDQWLSDYAACDLTYLAHYYRTGEKLDIRSCWRDGTPLVEPRRIPSFRPVRRLLRQPGRVI